MNEKKKMLVILLGIVVIVAFVVVFAVVNLKRDKKIYEQFEQSFLGEKPTLIYIGRPTCPSCNLLTPSLDEMTERYEFDYIYFNTDSYNSGYLKKVLEKLKVDEVNTPYLAIVSKEEVLDIQIGYIDYDKLFNFLKTNKVISEQATLPINYIDLKQYNTLIASDEPQLIVVGQSTCPHCVSAKIALNQIADEYKISINFLNLSYLTGEEPDQFKASLPYFNNENFGVPVMFIVKSNEMVARFNGFSGATDYISFLQEQGIIKND